MKRCPKCNREFDDELRFCLEDGTILVGAGVAPTAAPETAVLPTTGAGQSTISQVAPPDVPAVFGRAGADNVSVDKSEPDHVANAPIAPGIAIVIGVILVVGLLLSFAGSGFWGMVFTRRIPMILFCLAGMVVAILRSGKNPTASLLAGLSLGLYPIKSFVFSGISYSSLSLTKALGVQYSTLYITFTLMDNILYAIMIILMVSAVFVGRPRNN
jgi:hypothetical protein